MVTAAPSNLSFDGGTLAPHVEPSAEEKLWPQPSLALLVVILVPCVVLLFLLNCFLLIHRSPVLPAKKKAKRRGPPRSKYPCVLVDQNGRARLDSNKPLCDPRRPTASFSHGLEATLALGESCRGAPDRSGFRDHKLSFLTSDWESCSARAPRMTSAPCCSATHRSCRLRSQEKLPGWDRAAGDGGRGGSHGTYSELETRQNAVPPNSPEAAPPVTPKVTFSHKTSTQRKSRLGSAPFTPLGSINFDRPGTVHREDSLGHLSASGYLPGPGLDSDFGVSAGVSVHILSSDSDTCSWVSGMEWDHYDPCYLRRNRLRTRQNHHLPVLCSKQYWV
ncbi:protein huluwa-like [Spea bombifrons]|uniref:protein huluwa-like n=1 Tax=Spea bombifrons TaxID=233779 RepID=UPI00234BAEDF|nr:protein huluwa-like [Spea bombifrons]